MEESFEALEGTDYEILHDRPFAEIFTCLGFFFIYFIEEIVHFFVDSSVHPGHSDTVQVHRSFSIHSQACDAGSQNDVNNVPSASPRKTAFLNIFVIFKHYFSSLSSRRSSLEKITKIFPQQVSLS